MMIPRFPVSDSITSRLSPDEMTQFLFEMTACMSRYLAQEAPSAPPPKEPDPSESLTTRIHAILLRIGVPAHVCGFRYLTEAVEQAVLDPTCLSPITIRLYPRVADALSVPLSSVERGIRHAITLAWNRQKPGAVEQLFGRSVISTYDKPTNNELIASIVEYLTRTPA